MKLGVLSDTHGHLPRTRQALTLLKDKGAEHLMHCGDLGSEEVVTLLFEQIESGLPVTAVPGNVDEWDSGLILYAKKMGIPLPRVQRVTLGNLDIAVCHGHHADDMARLTEDQSLRILFTGHTHVARDETEGSVRIINPGAVCRASVPSVALFDTASESCEILPLRPSD